MHLLADFPAKAAGPCRIVDTLLEDLGVVILLPSPISTPALALAVMTFMAFMLTSKNVASLCRTTTKPTKPCGGPCSQPGWQLMLIL